MKLNGNKLVSIDDKILSGHIENHIVSLEEGDLKGLDSLTELHLSKNQIRSIDENMFRYLPRLEKLDL